jgi:hypothetical protein
MNHHTEANPPTADSAVAAHPYEAPRLTSLGTLADLTRGGSEVTEPDGNGFAGASGSF